MKEKRWSFFSSAFFLVMLSIAWTVGMAYFQHAK